MYRLTISILTVYERRKYRIASPAKPFTGPFTIPESSVPPIRYIHLVITYNYSQGAILNVNNTIDWPKDQARVYRVPLFWRILLSIVCLPMIVLIVWFVSMPFIASRFNQIPVSIYIILLIGGCTILLLIYICLSAFKCRIEIYSDRISYVTLLKTIEIPIAEVSGYRILITQYVRTLLILPRSPELRKIKTSLVIENKNDLLEWLNLNLVNLDTADFQEEMNEILHDTRLGETEEQRLSVLGRAKKWAKFLNGLGFLGMLWAFFRPQPYSYVIWTLITLPLITLSFVRHFDGAMKLNGKQQSAYPNVAMAFIMPCICLALRALIDFNILSWDNFWIPFAIVSFFICTITFLFAGDVRKNISAMLLMLFMCMIYGYSAVICLNGIMDTSSASIFKARIVGKSISSGKHTTYNLNLSAWGPVKSSKKVDVPKSVYDSHAVGGYADVILRHGRFEIPWFYVQ